MKSPTSGRKNMPYAVISTIGEYDPIVCRISASVNICANIVVQRIRLFTLGNIRISIPSMSHRRGNLCATAAKGHSITKKPITIVKLELQAVMNGGQAPPCNSEPAHRRAQGKFAQRMTARGKSEVKTQANI